jgi:hypothetical protein
VELEVFETFLAFFIPERNQKKEIGKKIINYFF